MYKRQQLKSVGFSFDWSRVIDTTQEDFYKWTQWIFLKMFEKDVYKRQGFCIYPEYYRIFQNRWKISYKAIGG